MINNILAKARLYTYRLLNYRPRSEQEIRDKLKKRDFGEAIIDSIVLELKNRSLIDDYNFARFWAKSRLQANGQCS